MYLKEFNLQTLDEIPKVSGLYYIYDNQDRLLYIGKAVNLRYRIKQHKTASLWALEYGAPCDIDFAWNHVSYIIVEPISKQFLKFVEKIMIYSKNPYLNFQTRQFYFNIDVYFDAIEQKRFEMVQNYWKDVANQ